MAALQGYGVKALVIAGLILLLQLPLLLVYGVLSERQERSQEVLQEVGQAWGGVTHVSSPVVVGAGAPAADDRSTEARMPAAQTRMTVQLETQVRQRSIYSAVLYDGTVDMDTTVTWPQNAVALRGEPMLRIYMPTVDGLQEATLRTADGREAQFRPGKSEDYYGDASIEAPLAGLLTQTAGAQTKLQVRLVLRGHGGFAVQPLGGAVEATMTSPWASPGFAGMLPTEREVADSGFSAQWTGGAFGAADPVLETVDTGEKPSVNRSMEVNFVFPLDHYQQVERVWKYGALFLLLTFTVFFLFEITRRVRVHPVQYLLVGAALVVFYLLLLSLSEYVAFGWAYLISALGAVTLVGGYALAVLRARKDAGVVTGLLVFLYAFLYVLLQQEDYALLAGSVAIFIALAVVMWLTRNLDWYSAEDTTEVTAGTKKGA